MALVERILAAVAAFRGLSEKPVGDFEVLGFRKDDTVIMRIPGEYLKGSNDHSQFKWLSERVMQQGAVLFILPDSWKFSILRSKANMNGLEAAADTAAEYGRDNDKI